MLLSFSRVFCIALLLVSFISSIVSEPIDTNINNNNANGQADYKKKSLNQLKEENNSHVSISLPVKNRCNAWSTFAFIFDQSPTHGTGKLLDYLQQSVPEKPAIKATFLVLTTHLAGTLPVAYLERAVKEGHCIGMSFSDKTNFADEEYGFEKIKDVLEKNAGSIKARTGYEPKFVKVYDYENVPIEKLDYITSLGYILVTHGEDFNDFRNPQNIIKNYERFFNAMGPNTRPGIISIHYDSSDEVVDVIGEVIKIVARNGYEFVTMNQCIGTDDCSLKGSERKGGILSKDGLVKAESSARSTYGSLVLSAFAIVLAMAFSI